MADSADHAERAVQAYPPMLALAAGLLTAPLAWLLQMAIAETLAAQSCYPHDEPLSAPAVPWLRAVLMALSVVCFLAGAAGSVIAWRNLRRIKLAQSAGSVGDGLRHTTLARFLGYIAALCTTLFMFALIATDIALAIVSPCRGW